MKYFNPSYWFKLWVLSVPLFNDETKSINAKSINNKEIKDWTNNNTNLQSINQEMIYTNSSTNYQPYNLNQVTNQNIAPFYQTELKTSTHKHRHEKNKKRLTKRCSPCVPGWNLPSGHNQQNSKFNNNDKIKFEGYNNLYKGKIKLNSETKKVEFLGNDQYFHWWFDGKSTKYLQITIYNQAEKQIEDITIWTRDWMTKIIEQYNLQNGINYEEGYIIKIYSKEPWRTWFNIGDNNNWERFAFTDSADWDWTWKYRIRNNNIINKDNDPLWKDFSDAYSFEINLGLIQDNNQNYIRQALKNKYPKFAAFTTTFSSQYSNFCACFSAKGYINSNNWYSAGELRPTFTYTTQTKLNELNIIIANDQDIKKWIEDINDWNSTLSQAIENAKTFTPQALYNWKRNEKETIKNYIARWNTNVRIINNELKLDELNKNVQGLKASFDSIKNQVNELDKRVTNLENTSNWNCANIIGITSGVISAIPVIGTIGGAITSVTSGACAIAGV